MLSSLICTFIDNHIRHHSGENLLWICNRDMNVVPRSTVNTNDETEN